MVVVRNRSIKKYKNVAWSFFILLSQKCLFIVAVNKLINWYMGVAPSGSIPDTTVLSESDKDIKQSRAVVACQPP